VSKGSLFENPLFSYKYEENEIKNDLRNNENRTFADFELEKKPMTKNAGNLFEKPITKNAGNLLEQCCLGKGEHFGERNPHAESRIPFATDFIPEKNPMINFPLFEKKPKGVFENNGSKKGSMSDNFKPEKKPPIQPMTKIPGLFENHDSKNASMKTKAEKEKEKEREAKKKASLEREALQLEENKKEM